MSMSATEKLMVMNVYKKTYKSWPKDQYWSLGECYKKTADLVGISVRSVIRIVKEHKTGGEFSSPQKPGPRTSFKDSIDEFTFAVIRRIVHQFFYRNEPPTVKKVMQVVNDDTDLPNFSLSTMRRILKHLNFKYATRKRNSCLIDRQDIILWRKHYLKTIKQYRREGKFIYYQDETWVNEGHTVSKTWVDTTIQSSRQAFSEGLTTGLKAPSGKGRRLILCHIGSEDGFVEEGLLLFESKQSANTDYHSEMNSVCFENWLRGILPKLKENSVLVLDNAPYHSRKIERIPTTAWRKENIKNWLTEKNLHYDETMVKAELLHIVKSNKSQYDHYFVDQLTLQHGVTILRLPPYHCELNPIEMVWAQVKGYVARNNKTFKLNEVKTLLNEGLNEVTPQQWKDCIKHIIDVEDKMCQLDHIIDDITEAFIINVTESDSDSNSDSEESLDLM